MAYFVEGDNKDLISDKLQYHFLSGAVVDDVVPL